MKHLSLASGLAVLGCLQHSGVLALQTSDSRGHLAARQNESWEGVTPQLVEAAIDAMNDAWYNETDGRWNSTTAWWLTGNALQAVCDYMYTTNDTQYLAMAEHTIQEQSGPLPWWPEGDGYFRADSTDDTGWWALALVRLYDITGNSSYLDMAKLDEAYIYSYWNSSTCGGGVIWDIPDLSYKNAISNELYLKLAASLHNRIPGDTAYLAKAQAAWTWFNDSGLLNAQHLINDGLTADNCSNNGDPMWTYNQGVILGGLAELYRATADESYLAAAQTIADAVLASPLLSPPPDDDDDDDNDGILYEYACEPTAAGCDNNQQAFKGIFARNLAELRLALLLAGGGGDDGTATQKYYADYLAANAQSVGTRDRARAGALYGLAWAGPYTAASVGTQASAVSLFVANLWA